MVSGRHLNATSISITECIAGQCTAICELHNIGIDRNPPSGSEHGVRFKQRVLSDDPVRIDGDGATSSVTDCIDLTKDYIDLMRSDR